MILLGLRSSARASRDGSLQPDWIGAWRRELCQLPLTPAWLGLHSAISPYGGRWVLYRSELQCPSRTHQAYVRNKASAHFLECHRAEPSLDLRNASQLRCVSLVETKTWSKIVHKSSTQMESCLLLYICPGSWLFCYRLLQEPKPLPLTSDQKGFLPKSVQHRSRSGSTSTAGLDLSTVRHAHVECSRLACSDCLNLNVLAN